MKLSKSKKWIGIGLLVILILWSGNWMVKNVNLNPGKTIGEPLDSLDGVVVCYNGGINHTKERNKTADGYNIGLKYQCVEYVKRYYLQHYGHKMPDTHGHGKDFFDPAIADGKLNPKRDLLQYTHPSKTRPQKGDLLVWKGNFWNKYGHVAIVAEVTENELTYIQQNPGPYGDTRETVGIEKEGGKWKLKDAGILGWLRKE